MTGTTAVQPTPRAGAPSRDAALAAARAIFIESRTKGDDWWDQFAVIRAHAPVFEFPDAAIWIVTGYAEAKAVLGSRHATVGFAARNDAMTPGWRDMPARANMSEWFGHKDGPVHVRTRSALNTYFMAKGIAQLSDFLDSVIAPLVARFRANGGGNFLEDIGFPMTAAVTDHILALSPDARPDFRHQIMQIMKTFDYGLSDQQWSDANRAAGDMRAFWRGEIDRRIADPDGPDMLSDLIRKDQFSRDELIVIAENILAAATDTTANSSTNGMLLLLNNPDQMALAKADPALRQAIPDEVFRLNSAAPITGRRMEEPLDVGGTTLPAGATVLVCVGAANRDPAVFDDPDRFDLSRPVAKGIPFGQGVHHCLGSLLARTILGKLFDQLLDQTEELALVGPAPLLDGIVLRHVSRLDMRVR